LGEIRNLTHRERQPEPQAGTAHRTENVKGNMGVAPVWRGWRLGGGSSPDADPHVALVLRRMMTLVRVTPSDARYEASTREF
jgi:hypothetical protein